MFSVVGGTNRECQWLNEGLGHSRERVDDLGLAEEIHFLSECRRHFPRRRMMGWSGGQGFKYCSASRLSFSWSLDWLFSFGYWLFSFGRWLFSIGLLSLGLFPRLSSWFFSWLRLPPLPPSHSSNLLGELLGFLLICDRAKWHNVRWVTDVHLLLLLTGSILPPVRHSWTTAFSGENR